VVKWHGHASLTIEWKGTRLVVDPLLGKSVSVARRFFDGLELPIDNEYDAVLLTHAHMDHFDPKALEEVKFKTLILPAGSDRFLNSRQRSVYKLRFAKLEEPLEVGALRILPLPARHGGWRYPWQRGLSARSYLIQCEGRSLYLAGDSAHGAHFEEIGRRFAPDYAVIPIGAYSPAFFLKERHLNPEEAILATRQLRSRFMMPCHFGTYRLSLERPQEPLLRFAEAIAATPIQPFFFHEDFNSSEVNTPPIKSGLQSFLPAQNSLPRPNSDFDHVNYMHGGIII
jgi:L-ascorbate metabolism protein UlaG (beta-lactamase superfamily)